MLCYIMHAMAKKWVMKGKVGFEVSEGIWGN